jgi:hypothetical protein
VSDFTEARSYDYVTLVDRATNDISRTREIIHDGFRVVLKPGQTERTVPQFLAEWLFRVDQQKVHTTDGEFICRFGIKDAPEEFVARVGDAVKDCSPIQIDTTRLEGWDTSYADRFSGEMKTIQLARRPQDYTNDAAGAVTFGKAER